jgi:D-arabinose 1-dehydrogenase-like Zn-dependent alcohol dehydrogenase
MVRCWCGGMAVGICGTDREIAEGAYGEPPSGEARLVSGHESLGEVLATGHRGTSTRTPESQLGRRARIRRCRSGSMMKKIDTAR